MRKGLKIAFIITGIFIIYSFSFIALQYSKDTKQEKSPATPSVYIHNTQEHKPTPTYLKAKIDRYKFINKYEKKISSEYGSGRAFKEVGMENNL